MESRNTGFNKTQHQTTASRQQHQADQKRIKKLQKELNRKEKALAEAAAILVLRKKLTALWGESEDN